MKIITDDISRYDKNWWEKFYTEFGHKNNEEELNTFRHIVPIVGDKTIIDIGCGEGEASQFFDNYTGIDWSEVAINRCKTRWNKEFLVGDIPEIKKHYDFALLSQVMEHLENPKEYIDKIKTIADKVIVIIPNGELSKIIMDNDMAYLKTKLEDVHYHYATYDTNDIESMFPKMEWVTTSGTNLTFIV